MSLCKKKDWIHALKQTTRLTAEVKSITMKPQLKLESIRPIQVRKSCFLDNKNTISFVLCVILYLACIFLRVI